MADVPPGVAPITDRRPTPRGVLPRGVQTWLMAGLAIGILGIILVTGRPEPADRQPGSPARQDLVPNPGRLRDYQEDRKHLRGAWLTETPLCDVGPSLPPALLH